MTAADCLRAAAAREQSPEGDVGFILVADFMHRIRHFLSKP